MRYWSALIRHLDLGRPRRSGAPALAALVLAIGLMPQPASAQSALNAVQSRLNFDHLTTGFELTGQHRDLPCESCHVNAIFKGTPTDCGACHGIGTVVRATAKPRNHILSTDQCGACHTPVAWNPAVNFDHTQARGNCSTCHNGTMAQGKGPTHIITDLECDACHTTLTWAGATFNHVGVTSGCAACHDNVHAMGVTATHVPIGTPVTPCESCHSPTNYTTWNPGVIHHPAVSALTCASCHTTANVNPGGWKTGSASITAPTLSVAGHTTIAAAGVAGCMNCHATAPYMGMIASSNTAAGDSRPNTTLDSKHPATGDCGNCHTTAPTFALDVTAGKPSNHIPTTTPSAQCHA